MKDLAAGERLGRKVSCAPFIPHGRGLMLFMPLKWNSFFEELEPKVFFYTFLLTVKRNCKYRMFAIKGMICLDVTGS